MQRVKTTMQPIRGGRSLPPQSGFYGRRGSGIPL